MNDSAAHTRRKWLREQRIMAVEVVGERYLTGDFVNFILGEMAGLRVEKYQQGLMIRAPVHNRHRGNGLGL